MVLKVPKLCPYESFKAILTRTVKAPKGTDTITPGATDAKELLKLRNANDVAYSILSMSVKDSVSFGAIYNGITSDLPDGDASLAWKNLQTIFKPVSDAKKHELEQQFNQCGLHKESKNPDEWFVELEHLRLQLLLDFKVTYDDDKLI